MRSMVTSTTSRRRRLARPALILACAWLLGACTGMTRSDLRSMYVLGKSMVGGSQPVTLEQAATVPYASLGVRIGDSNELMLILASDENGKQLWTSSARIAITTQNGRIVDVAGLPHDLHISQIRQGPLGQDGARAIKWLADFPNLGLYSVPIACRDTPGGDDTIVILGQNIHTRRIDETCASRSEQLDWTFHNRFWTDPASGLVWRSIQHVNPKIDPLEIEILRPPE